MGEPRDWTFLTNHGHVALYLALQPEARLRDVAESVGITERAVQQIVGDLADAHVVVKTRNGRRNSYEVDRSSHLRHPLESSATVGQLIDLVTGASSDAR